MPAESTDILPASAREATTVSCEIFATLVVSRSIVMPLNATFFCSAISRGDHVRRSDQRVRRRSGDAAEMLRAASKRRRDETIDVWCRQ